MLLFPLLALERSAETPAGSGRCYVPTLQLKEEVSELLQERASWSSWRSGRCTIPAKVVRMHVMKHGVVDFGPIAPLRRLSTIARFF
ncbi:hypothetical protein VTL71DRAFT_12876, partial [Oculimacula yallundae]